MSTSSVAKLTLNQAADALAAGSISALELTNYYLQRIAVDALKTNAYISVAADGARAQAAASDQRRANGQSLGKLDGIPLAIKDNIDVLEQVTTAGVAALKANVAKADAHCVAKLRHAGAVLLGKLNLNEGALGADNANPDFGNCNNPINHKLTPGGSSGGSAAAVAAGLCVAALGTDTMGSVRIPAAYCGIVGFKPSYELIRRSGLITACRRLDHVGTLTHSVRDAVILLALLSAAPLPALDQNKISRARIGVLINLAGHGVADGICTSFADAIERLRTAGFSMHDLNLDDVNFGQFRRAGLLATEADMAIVHAAYLDQLSPRLRGMLAFPAGKSALELARAYEKLDEGGARLLRCFDNADFILTPSTPQQPFEHGNAAPANQADLTSLANMAGCPAISIPIQMQQGLPVGMQIIAPPGHDLNLLAMAAAFESTLALQQ